jgi:hypothetical protein
MVRTDVASLSQQVVRKMTNPPSFDAAQRW